MTTVGINGFGRVGRAFFRASLDIAQITVVAINDPFIDVEYMAYLLKSDSVHGRFKGTVEVSADKKQIVVDGQVVHVYASTDPGQVPWGTAGADYVVEASGVYTTQERAAAHLAGGARRVVVAAPSADAPQFIFGANEEKYTGQPVIAAGSCTAVALAPLLKVLNEAHGVQECLFTTVHAATSGQKVVDGSAPKEWRSGRSVMNNIIPAASGAARCIAKVLPSLASKVHGSALRVPVQNGCVLDMTIRCDQTVTKTQIDTAIKQAAEGRWRGIVGVSEELMVSSDVIGEAKSCVFDVQSSNVVGNSTVRAIAFYDNEVGYAFRVANLITYTAGIQQ